MKERQPRLQRQQKLTAGGWHPFLLMIYAVVPGPDLGIDLLPTLGWWFELSTLFFSASI